MSKEESNAYYNQKAMESKLDSKSNDADDEAGDNEENETADISEEPFLQNLS